MITYIARNITNGKFYIGSTVNFKKRKKRHLNSVFNYPFQSALRKNPDDFIWETHEDDINDRELEQFLLDMFYGTELCYNLSDSTCCPDNRGEKNAMFGRKHTDEANERNRQGHTGEKNSHYGKNFTKEHRLKIGESRKGKKLWININGETLFQKEDPGEEWQNGRKWKPTVHAFQ